MLLAPLFRYIKLVQVRNQYGSEPARKRFNSGQNVDQERLIAWIGTRIITWFRSRIFMSFPLNINLIIPFKDNKGERLKMYSGEIEAFRGQLEDRVSELKDELDMLFSGNCALTIAGRSDGSTKKFFWRFKSSKQDRKFNRLNADSVVSYLSEIDDERKLRIKEIELDLIYINANMKLLKGMKDAIEQSVNDREALLLTSI